MLIPDYTLKRIPGGCEDDAGTVSVQVDLPADVSAVYPYVNGRLPGCAYNHAGKTLYWSEGGHKIVLRDRTLAISQLADWDAAIAAARRLVSFLNDTWERREEIAPREQPYPQPTPLAVYRGLPGSNCRDCGEATCYTFALKLIAREVALEQCTPLAGPEWEARLSDLQAMLVETPGVLFNAVAQ